MSFCNRAFEIFKNMDWELLKEQKQELLKLHEETGKDFIMGIVHILDDMQDIAVDELGIPENKVFHFENE